MSNDVLQTYIRDLKSLLFGPPFLVLLYISGILVLASILSNHYFDEVWTLLVFSTIGAVWRHVIRDLREHTAWGKRYKNLLTTLYQIGNVALVVYFAQLLLPVS